MPTHFADRLIAAIQQKGNPCVVGLDPRIDLMPDFVVSRDPDRDIAIRSTLARFNEVVLDVVAPLVPAVKPQIAFYEQYGIPGLLAFQDTLQAAKARGLVVIADVKRNDIASTADAYANAFLGRTTAFGASQPVFDADCVTVSPFLGKDSLLPFAKACAAYDKGLFVLVKTSNPGSADLQDQILTSTGRPLSEHVARITDGLGREHLGASGYSSIGAVVGATFAAEARVLRKLMPKAIFLVPGYGAQGGTAQDAAACFNTDGLGAVVNASRSITYAHGSPSVSEGEFRSLVGDATKRMAADLRSVLG